MMLAQEGSASHGQFHSLGYHMCWWLPAHRHTGPQQAWRRGERGRAGGRQERGQGADVSTTSSSAGSGTVSVTLVTVVPSGCLIDVVVR